MRAERERERELPREEAMLARGSRHAIGIGNHTAEAMKPAGTTTGRPTP